MNIGNTHSNSEESIRPVLAGFFGNLALAFLKLGFVLLGGNKLILMDGLFSLMAVSAFSIPWQARVLENRGSDSRYPYGLGKILFINMAVVGLLGLVLAAHMLYYSLIVMAGLKMGGSYTLAVMVTLISIITNEVLYRYLRGKSKKSSNGMLAMSGRYNRYGSWISTFVLLLLILAGLGAGYLIRVGIAVISIAVFFVGLRMVFLGFSGIMDKVPSPKILERIRTYAQKVSEVKEIVNIKARYVGTLLHIDMWISVGNDLSMEKADNIARRVRRQLMEKIPFAREVNIIIA
ncbi:MAG TPA: cation diffusion facilitator family transporter [Planctomycetes bacterium]|nr:cation diffusion facilitator family transporter [Planctomycetota bacterium]